MAWVPLKDRLKNLPLILCGPIVRRVEPDAVTVWVALKDERTVTLRIYESDQDNQGAGLKLEGTRTTVKLGKHLHLVAVTAHAVAGGSLLEWGKLYRYNLFFDLTPNSEFLVPVNKSDLFAFKVMVEVEDPFFFEIRKTRAREAAVKLLTYCHVGKQNESGAAAGAKDIPTLPSFVLPPNDMDNLRIVHGSCRKPHAEGRDAFPALDMMIESTATEPNRRPHQLFLTGDQIYQSASATMLLMLTDAGNTLLAGLKNSEIAWEEPLPPGSKMPSEYLRNTRHLTTIEHAGFEGGKSHCLGLGEYYAMYLFTWSDVLWPGPSEFPDFEDVYYGMSHLPNIGEEQLSEYKEHQKRHRPFHKSLPQVRRALANVPTYMIFDDHEVTDDLFMIRDWCDVVLKKPLGRRIIQNGLLAYAVFQAWGNTPDQFADSEAVAGASAGAKLLEAAQKWVESECKNAVQAQKIGDFLGLPRADNIFTDDGKGDTVLARLPGSLDWHYIVNGPNHEVIVLDVRTWRAYPEGRFDPASPLSKTGFEKQIPAIQTPPQMVTIVVSPIPVLSVPYLSQSIPISIYYFILFFKYLIFWRDRRLHPIYTLEMEAEAWEGQSAAFETLLSKLASRVQSKNGQKNTRVLFLSGDVHFSYTSRLQYRADLSFTDKLEHQPAPINSVFAHLVASPLKKEDLKHRLFHCMGYEPFFDSLPESEEWYGWRVPPKFEWLSGDSIDVGLDKDKSFFWTHWQPRQLRNSPAMLLVNELPVPPTNVPKPDWRYRIDYILAENKVRKPAPFEPRKVPTPPPGNLTKALESYLAMAGNHKDWAKKWGDGKEIVGVNNIGEITFNWKNGEKSVIHELWWRLESKHDDEELLKPFPLSKFQVSLDFDEDEKP